MRTRKTPYLDTSRSELFTKIVNYFAKISILDILLGLGFINNSES